MKRSRIKPRNAERAARARAEDFGSRDRLDAIAAMPCVCGGRDPACTGGWSEPSHVRSRGAGGDARCIVPMSTGCHRAWHQHGRETWCRAAGVTLDQLMELAQGLEETAGGAPW